VKTGVKSDTIAAVCSALSRGDYDYATSVLKRDYPFAPDLITRREYGALESTRVFIRDGFIDRYTGERLIYPPVLRVLSAELPAEFPFHPNWKTDVTHPAFWEVGATVDHLMPVTRGGADNESNWVTTSMARNSAKMNWTVEELGWALQPPGEFADWDGPVGWFIQRTKDQPALLVSGSVRQWHRAAKIVLSRS
jgi:5-methylcytosine-specific restriction endonuclease McrA